MNCNVHNLFPFPVLEALLDKESISKEVDFIMSKIQEDGVLRSNAGNNFQTTVFSVLDDWELTELNKSINQTLKVFADQVLCYDYEKLYITQSWINVNPPETSHDYHNHKNSVLSGVLFLHTAQDCGNMILYKPERDITPKVKFDETNYFTWANRYFSPIDNQLLIFPSNLYHSVSENKSDITRVSLAFNTFLTPLGCESHKMFAQVL